MRTVINIGSINVVRMNKTINQRQDATACVTTILSGRRSLIVEAVWDLEVLDGITKKRLAYGEKECLQLIKESGYDWDEIEDKLNEQSNLDAEEMDLFGCEV